MNDDDFLASFGNMAEVSRLRKEKAKAESLLHKPDWTHWNNLAVVRVDDAIVLSCDISPEWHGNRTDIADVRRRKAIVESAMAANTLRTGDPYKLVSHDNGDRTVTLPEFRRWGESLPTPFTFPVEFPKLQHAAQTAATNIELDPRTRGNLLRIVRALDVMAKLPPRGPAPSVETQLQQLGFESPKEATIRKILDEARALEPDGKPQ